jgi:hypothetical protein
MIRGVDVISSFGDRSNVNLTFMATDYSADTLLAFLDHAAEKGLMPAATATALLVAARTVFAILTDQEQSDVRNIDLDAVNRRFENKHARDFTSGSLKTYGSRVRRAVAQFISWRDDPGNFRPKTRSTAAMRARRPGSDVLEHSVEDLTAATTMPASAPGTYQTSFPLRPGTVVTLFNLPEDLSAAEAKQLSDFITVLARGGIRKSV